MKKILVLILITSILLTACSGEGAAENNFVDLSEPTSPQFAQNEVANTNESLEPQAGQGAQEPAETAPQGAEVNPEHMQNVEALQSIPTEPSTTGVDIDLTQMNSTMVYSQVFDMMTNPDTYIGKVIKMQGSYYTSQNPENDMVYHLLVILDATGCCPQGIEFLATGDASYPQVSAQYPEITETVEVTGVFETYMENELMYFRIVSDNITIVS